MKKIWLSLLLPIVAVQVLGTVSAFASTGYNPSGDTHINLNLPILAGLLPSTGTLLFNVQEDVYRTVGLDVAHDYIWVGVSGTNLLAVDPPRPMM